MSLRRDTWESEFLCSLRTVYIYSAPGFPFFRKNPSSYLATYFLCLSTCRPNSSNHMSGSVSDGMHGILVGCMAASLFRHFGGHAGTGGTAVDLRVGIPCRRELAGEVRNERARPIVLFFSRNFPIWRFQQRNQIFGNRHDKL